MKAGLVGGSYVQEMLGFDAQRSVNLFPVIDETQQGKDIAAMYGTPGLTLFANNGNGPNRGFISCGNTRAFRVAENAFQEVFSDGTITTLGTINTRTGSVSMAENGLQVFIATGTSGYVFTFATNVFVQVTDTDFPGAVYVTFQDGYFIITPPYPNQGKFYISAIYNGLVWDALDFATAESSPDGLIAAFSAYGKLFMFGDRTIEIWYNSGAADFPYARASDGNIETGCVSAFSITKFDNSIAFIGRDNFGQGMIFKIVGNVAQRISTTAIELILSKLVYLSSLTAYAYQQRGFLRYVLTGGDLPTTLVLDAATKIWHEWAHRTDMGLFEQHLGIGHMFAFGKNLTGDRRNGKMYQIDPDAYTDAGDLITRTRTFTHIYDEGNYFRISSLLVDFDFGATLSGQVEPIATLQLSQDFGHTWSNEYPVAIGTQGQYFRKCVWRRLGVSQQATFKVSITAQSPVRICGASFA